MRSFQEHFEGLSATRDEMSHSDWKQRLARANKESDSGKGKNLEDYIRDRSAKQ